MFKVIKATELDGVTIKESDAPEILGLTGVTKRADLHVSDTDTLEDLRDSQYMMLTDLNSGYYCITSNINYVREEGEQIQVGTKNTIYFLERV
jgi:hypothetical protein